MAEQNAQSPWPRRAWNYFKIILAIVLVWFVLTKTNLGEVLDLLKQVSLSWLVISFVLFCMLTLIKTYQYYLLTERQAPYSRVLYVVITQNAFSNFVASGAGIASYLTMLSVDEGVRFRKVVSSFIIAKMGDLLSVWIVLFATALLVWPQIAVVRGVVIFLLAAILAAVGIFLAAALLRQKFMSIMRAILARLGLDKFSIVQRGVDILASFAEQDSSIVLRRLLTGLLYSLIYMGVTLLWFYANIRAYSLIFPFAVVSFVNAFIQLISWIPIQVFGGLGVNETSLVYLFGIFNLPASQMVAMSIGLRVLLYLFTLIVLLYLPLSKLSVRGKTAK